METRIEKLRSKAELHTEILTNKEKDIIYFRSVENFLLYIDKFQRQDVKLEVINALEIYFEELGAGNFLFNMSQKREIALNLLAPIGLHYKKYFSFKHHNNVKVLIFLGIHIDLLLLIVGILKIIYYIPAFTVLFVLRWLYIEHFYGKVNKVY